MNKHEFETVPHNPINFRVFLVNIIYRTPHIHKDFEISCVLEGNITVNIQGKSHMLSSYEIFLVNPYESHEIISEAPALILSLQLPPDFFVDWIPQINQMIFLSNWLISSEIEDVKEYALCLINIADTWLQHSDFWELKCISLIHELFYQLLHRIDHKFISAQQQRTSQAKGLQMRKLIKFIDEHYSEKLLLSDIAAKEHLSLYYLSHFFKDTFGISFQDYLSRVRCEHARRLLLQTNLNLMDIYTRCGFSDSKYFNRNFYKQYGCSPKEYRNNFRASDLIQQRKSILTIQEFLSRKNSITLIKRIKAVL